MSDYRIIGAVTQTLALSIQRAVASSSASVSHAVVTTQRPDKPTDSDQPRVNVYMFHVQPNASLRNHDLPSWDGDRLLNTPTLPLDLYYLLSFYGSEERSSLDSQLLMGLTLSALHAHPIIPSEALRETLNDQREDVEYNPVSLAIETLSVHELSRLWQTFPQVPLVLSTAIRATTILIASDDEAGPAGPVLDRNFDMLRPAADAPTAVPQPSSSEPDDVDTPVPPATFRFSLPERIRRFWGSGR